MVIYIGNCSSELDKTVDRAPSDIIRNCRKRDGANANLAWRSGNICSLADTC
uniref:Uncharacterized protein n=1 Tax=Arundo donax TaxID=35708 RepID=A0A0A8XN93_ARUDO